MATYYVYILASRPGGALYVGVTNDLVRRVHEHRTDAIPGHTRRYNIKQLVYLDATVPAHGQAATGAFTEGTADVLSQMSSGTDWLLPALPLSAVGVSLPADVEWMTPRRGPHPLATLHEPVHLESEAARRLPRSYIRCTQRQGLVGLFGVDPLAPFYAKAVAEGWPVRDLDSGHDAMVTVPIQVAEVLADLA